MAIAMLVDNPEGSQEIYDKVRAQLGLAGPAGGIFHAAGPKSKRRLAGYGSRRRMHSDSEMSA